MPTPHWFAGKRPLTVVPVLAAPYALIRDDAEGPIAFSDDRSTPNSDTKPPLDRINNTEVAVAPFSAHAEYGVPEVIQLNNNNAYNA